MWTLLGLDFELANGHRETTLLVRCVVLLDDATCSGAVQNAECLPERLLCYFKCCSCTNGLDDLAKLLLVAAVVDLALACLTDALDC